MKARALFVALGVAAIAFAVAFAVPVFASEPVAWYYPAERAWAFEVRPAGVAIDLYGRLAQAILAWALAFAVALPIARRRAEIGVRAVGLVTAWLLTAILFVMLFAAWTLHYRVPVPLR